MIAKLRAIETVYAGRRFRSRLEARWAVFFDALGIEWQYEPEGFELADGTWYLPDFFLPRFHRSGVAHGFWAEVKPKGEWALKARTFAFDAKICMLLLDGEPSPSVYTVVDGRDPDPEMDEISSWSHEYACCFTSKYLPGGRNADEYRLFVLPGYEREDGSIDLDDMDHTVMTAIYAARSARFEFGEQGAAFGKRFAT